MGRVPERTLTIVENAHLPRFALHVACSPAGWRDCAIARLSKRARPFCKASQKAMFQGEQGITNCFPVVYKTRFMFEFISYVISPSFNPGDAFASHVSGRPTPFDSTTMKLARQHANTKRHPIQNKNIHTPLHENKMCTSIPN
jgi:hypothetical protein